MEAQDRSSIRSKFSIRLTLFLLFFITVIPIAVFVVLTYLDQRDFTSRQIAENSNLLVSAAAASQDNYIEDTHQLLEIMASLPLVQPGASVDQCNRLFENFIAETPLYSNFGVATLDGNIYCSGIKLQNPVNISDRKYFHDAIENENFSVGQYQIGRVTGKPALNFGHPVYNQEGELVAVVYAALDLSWLNQLAEKLNLPEGATLTVFDQQGTILVRYPDFNSWVGQNFEEADVVQNVLSGTSLEGTIVAKGLDQVERLYFYRSLQFEEGSSTDAYITIGYPTSLINDYAQSKLYQNLAQLIFVAILAFLLTWVIGNILIAERFKALEEANQFKSQFVSIVAHQLRTPINSILWSLEVISDEVMKKLSKETKELLSDTSRSAKHLIDLIKQLLNLSRIDSGRLAINPVPTQLNEIVETSVREHIPKVKEKKLKLKLELSDELPIVTLDPLLIHEVINNLLSNAIKYTEKDGEIKISTRVKSQFITFSIQDSGIGIPDQDKEKLFESFYRGSNVQVGDKGGTGLGLYLAKKLVTLSGGSIDFESELNKGTHFWFTVPISGVHAKKGEVNLNV